MHRPALHPHLPRAAAALTAAVVATLVGASAARPATGPVLTYAVRSISITVSGSVVAQGATGADGSKGTVKTVIKGTFRGSGAALAGGLQKPETANESICTPDCPRFVADGEVSLTRTYTPDGGKPQTCTAKKTLKGVVAGRVYVTSVKTGPKALQIRIADAKGPNDLYGALRGTCKVPDLAPVDTYDYSGYGEIVVPVSKLGGATIGGTLVNSLKPPTYPWPATGATKVTTTFVLTKK